MKIAYNDKDCYISNQGEWEECTGCVFCQSKTDISWPCDFIPQLKCYGGEIYKQTDELGEIFSV